MPAFGDVAAIKKWQGERLIVHGGLGRDQDLPLVADHVVAEARVIYRSGARLALVDDGSGCRAYVIDAAWQGLGGKTVHVRKTTSPHMPETLDWLDDDLSSLSARVSSEVALPGPPTQADLPIIAEAVGPQVEAWIGRNLKLRSRSPLNLDGHAVGYLGYLGRSRCMVLPIAPLFDLGQEGIPDNNIKRACETQIRDWTSRIVALLNNSKGTKAHPVYRDLILWLVPTYEPLKLQTLINGLNRQHFWDQKAYSIPGIKESLVPLHRVESIEYTLLDEWLERRHRFDNLISVEATDITARARRYKENKWLKASLQNDGLLAFMEALREEGVTFHFGSTISLIPTEWGQQAVLPDGRQLLVLFHLSNSEEGLAFAFSATNAKATSRAGFMSWRPCSMPRASAL